MASDAELIRLYSIERSDEAFAELVGRYVNLVYFGALRLVGEDRTLAEDVAQEVFAALAIRVDEGRPIPLLAGWLHLTTRYKAAHAREADRRRRLRETKVNLMESSEKASEEATDWDRLRPLIDATLAEQNSVEREIVLLRYFQGRQFSEIGEALGMTAEAVRFRLSRACQKMRKSLRRRGLESTEETLEATLSMVAKSKTVLGLANRVAGGALIKAAAGRPAALHWINLMTKTKVLLSAAAIAALATTIMWRYEQRMTQKLEAELSTATEAFLKNEQQNAEFNRRAAMANKESASLEARIAALSSKGSVTQASTNLNAANVQGKAGMPGGSPVDERLKSDPQVRTAAAAIVKSLFARRYGHFLAESGFSPDQISQMLDLMVQAENFGTGEDSFALRPNSASQEQAVEQMNAMWGDPSVQQAYQEYTRTYLVREVATDLAANLYSTSTPLTSAQSDQLTNILASTTPAYQNGGRAAKGAINWDVALPEAQAILSPDQFAVLEGQATLLSQKIWYTAPMPGLPTSVYSPVAQAPKP